MDCSPYTISTWQESGTSYETLVALLAKAGEELPDPFSLRKEKIDLCEYANKLIQNGMLYLVLDSAKTPVGVMGFYANDHNSLTAYLSIICLFQQVRGKGIANKLMQILCHECHKNGMRQIVLKVHKGNISAMQLYNKHGFQIVAETTDKFILSKSLEAITDPVNPA